MTQDPNPKQLNAKHYKLLLLIHQGISIKRASELVKYSVTRSSQVVNSPAGKAYLAELRAAAKELAVADPIQGIQHMLMSEAMPSVKHLVRLRDSSDSERIQLNAANSLLDRTVPRKIQQAPPAAQFVLPEKLAERMLSVLNETAKLEQAIDVTPASSSEDE